MEGIRRPINTKQVAINEIDYNICLDHILKHYGHIGKFFGAAGREKMERDLEAEKKSVRVKPE